jgi:hypothetical protein
MHNKEYYAEVTTTGKTYYKRKRYIHRGYE